MTSVVPETVLALPPVMAPATPEHAGGRSETFDAVLTRAGLWNTDGRPEEEERPAGPSKAPTDGGWYCEEAEESRLPGGREPPVSPLVFRSVQDEGGLAVQERAPWSVETPAERAGPREAAVEAGPPRRREPMPDTAARLTATGENGQGAVDRRRSGRNPKADPAGGSRSPSKAEGLRGVVRRMAADAENVLAAAVPAPEPARRVPRAGEPSGDHRREAVGRSAAKRGPAASVPPEAAKLKGKAVIQESVARADTLPVEASPTLRLPLGDTVAAPRVAVPAAPTGAAAAQRFERLQQVVERFGEYLATLTRQNGGTLTIELTPRSLGRITMNCRVSGKEMFVELVTDTSASRTFLAEHAQALREVVQQSGYALSQLDVKTRQEGSDARQAPRPPARGRGRGGQTGRPDEAAGAIEDTVSPPTGYGRFNHSVWLVA